MGSGAKLSAARFFFLLVEKMWCVWLCYWWNWCGAYRYAIGENAAINKHVTIAVMYGNGFKEYAVTIETIVASTIYQTQGIRL